MRGRWGKPEGGAGDSRTAVRVVRELKDWPRHSEESVRAMREGLAALQRDRADGIID